MQKSQFENSDIFELEDLRVFRLKKKSESKRLEIRIYKFEEHFKIQEFKNLYKKITIVKNLQIKRFRPKSCAANFKCRSIY